MDDTENKFEAEKVIQNLKLAQKKVIHALEIASSTCAQLGKLDSTNNEQNLKNAIAEYLETCQVFFGQITVYLKGNKIANVQSTAPLG